MSNPHTTITRNSVPPTLVTISATSNTSAQLALGSYIISSDINCTFLQGASDVVALTTSRRLWEATYRNATVTDVGVDDYVAVIGEDGTLSIEQI